MEKEDTGKRKGIPCREKSGAEQEGNVEAAETMRRHPADKQTVKPYMEKPAADMKEKIELYQRSKNKSGTTVKQICEKGREER